MRNQKIVLTIAVGALSVLSCQLYAQHQTEPRTNEATHMDSVAIASQREIQAEKIKDANTIADYQNERKETKAKAKEARRVENEATTAARESRYALRAEKRAQKARKNADRQADKARKSRAKSDKN